MYRSIGAFWGGGSSGMGCSGVPPIPPFAAALGELSVFETWAPPHCCGSWLRPKLLPPIGSSLGRMRFGFLLLCPSFFWSLWAGNQVTGGTGATGDGGAGGGRMRWGAKICRVGWLTRRRGRCPRTPARDSSPLDPRQGGMAPLEPPSSLARRWSNGLKRCGGSSRCGVSGRCGDAVGAKICRAGG